MYIYIYIERERIDLFQMVRNGDLPVRYGRLPSFTYLKNTDVLACAMFNMCHVGLPRPDHPCVYSNVLYLVSHVCVCERDPRMDECRMVVFLHGCLIVS